MRVPSRKRSKLGTACVLMLAVSVALFATYLKVLAPLVDVSGGGSQSHMKLWQNGAAARDIKVKLVTTSDFTLLPPAVLDHLQRGGMAAWPVPAPSAATKDVLAESVPRFRPPPFA